jgi:hypothetical protein
MLEPRAVWKQADRQPGISQAPGASRRTRLFVIAKFDPFEIDVGAMEKIPDGVSRGIAPRSEQADFRGRRARVVLPRAVLHPVFSSVTKSRCAPASQKGRR